MISCTEFIPCYSELFTYLEEKHGRAEVDRFWEYLFQPNGKGIPLINHVKEEGIRGCWTYWTKSLNEEAADFTMYLSEKRGFYLLRMHRCPSKGHLLELKEEIGIEPYHDYCLHCDHYRAAVEKVGLKYIFNFAETDRAACSILIYDPERFDGRVIVDEETLVMDRRASDNEYFHPDFHSSLNRGIEYLGANYGGEAVEEFLTRYTKRVHGAKLEAVGRDGLAALEEMIRETYRKERSEDALTVSRTEDALSIEIAYCPAVKHLHSIGRVMSSWYPETSRIPMETFAQAGGFRFVWESYEEASGAARFRFEAQPVKDNADE